MLHQRMFKNRQQLLPTITKIVYPYEYKLLFDGCSKGNPGLSGAGAVIYNSENNEIWAGKNFVGLRTTKNQAEYAGLILGLKKAREMNIKNLSVKSDSQLVIHQMTGQYRCNSPHLFDLFVTAKIIEKSFENIEYNHVLRILNTRAYELSNQAVIFYKVNKYL